MLVFPKIRIVRKPIFSNVRDEEGKFTNFITNNASSRSLFSKSTPVINE